MLVVLPPRPRLSRNMYSSTSTTMISSTTASTPPPPPPPVSTTVVRSRSTSSRSSAIGNSPCCTLLLRNERTLAGAVPRGGAMVRLGVIILFAALFACDRQTETRPSANEVAKVAPARQTAKALDEPNRPIDPTSAEAAGQIVQSYGALIEQKRWPDANALWSDKSLAAKFQAGLATLAEVHLEIGNL